MKNKYETRGDVTAIFINNKGTIIEALIDTDDLEKVSSFPNTWCVKYKYSGPYVFGFVNGKNYGKRTQWSLHRIIMDCPEHLVVDHINHNTLDNRKSNLRNVTKKINANNRKEA